MHLLHGYSSEDDFNVIAKHECATIAGLCEVILAIAVNDPRGEDVGEEVAVCIGNRCVNVYVIEFKDKTRALVLADQ